MMETRILFVGSGTREIRTLMADLTAHKIFNTSDQSQALELCRDQEIHLVIIDQAKGCSDICRFFAELKTVRPGLAGILISSTIDADAAIDILNAGFSGFVKKPVVFSELLERVVCALNTVFLCDENTRLRTLLPLYSLGEQFLASSSEREVLDGLVTTAAGITDAAAVSVMLYDKKEGCLRIAVSKGIDKEIADKVRIFPGDKIAGWVFQKGKPVILNRNTQKDSIFADLLQRLDITSAISFPLTVRGTILGVLNVSRTRDGISFSQSDIEMLNVICSQATMALDNVRAIVEREEKARMLALFEQYVAPEVASVLVANNNNLNELGEVKRMTVLFADIRNFTKLVQRMSLDKIRLFLNEFFRLFTEIIFHHQGTVDKFMGDAVLAVFGSPVSLENPNNTAVLAAVEIGERFEDLRKRRMQEQDFFKDIEIGIGITCGDIFFGNVGSAKRFDYTVVGTHVNIAQRLASQSRQGSIYMTRSVMESAGEIVTGAEPVALKLKGLEHEISVYEIKKY